MEYEKEILQRHLERLMENTKADDDEANEVIDALRSLMQIWDGNIWISANVNLMIAMDNGGLNIYEKGIKLNNIKNLKFEYKDDEVSSLSIEQNI